MEETTVYFQKLDMWGSQYLLLEMRNLLAGQVMCFSHLLKGRFYSVYLQCCPTALRSFLGRLSHQRGEDASHWLSHQGRGRRLLMTGCHIKEGGVPHDWRLFCI
ncbi:hypothetical protein I79_004755 [Cricetulus griseus]|uniref:Uncharacterized protein n=1 Tax=Cricetulus griseus TaxID=10029 RepID=G3H3E0_CRIGR|nr:hypothetical protein I79_004755 [Cricetulus griseus]